MKARIQSGRNTFLFIELPEEREMSESQRWMPELAASVFDLPQTALNGKNSPVVARLNADIGASYTGRVEYGVFEPRGVPEVRFAIPWWTDRSHVMFLINGLDCSKFPPRMPPNVPRIFASRQASVAHSTAPAPHAPLGIVILGRDDGDRVLNAVARDEYGEYVSLKSQGCDLKAAESVVRLVQKTRQVWLVARYKKVDKDISAEASVFAWIAQKYAWERAIQCWKNARDAEAKALILGEWNSAMAGTEGRGTAVYGLSDEWDRAFETDAFLSAFRTTSDPTEIRSFCELFGKHGYQTEEDLLVAKLEWLKTAMAPSMAYAGNEYNINRAIMMIQAYKDLPEGLVRVGPP